MGTGKMLDAFICDAIRTPIGRYGGGLATMRPDDLMDRLGAVDARDAPVTRDILQAIADMQGERS